MRIGVTVPMANGEVAEGRVTTFGETADFARRAELLALDSIWVFDHLLWYFEGEPDEGPNEAWTILSALAPVVPRVELGALVMCSSFRNAGLMAKMAGTLDEVSGGRLILGLGCGWHKPEYDAFGLPRTSRSSRGCCAARRSISMAVGVATPVLSSCRGPTDGCPRSWPRKAIGCSG
jgi:alkanesulfonate monooxygenase SsuD/methylene tetrahydromethanopterin reductase-like flavin-dependent oxidoreductase (luciferase family)